MDKAQRLLSAKERDAFDISLEPKENYERYDTGRFGRGFTRISEDVRRSARWCEEALGLAGISQQIYFQPACAFSLAPHLSQHRSK